MANQHTAANHVEGDSSGSEDFEVVGHEVLTDDSTHQNDSTLVGTESQGPSVDERKVDEHCDVADAGKTLGNDGFRAQLRAVTQSGLAQRDATGPVLCQAVQLLEPATCAVGHAIRLRLELDDLAHAGVRSFSDHLFRGPERTFVKVFEMALEAVRRHLYPRDKAALLKICGALRPNTEGKTSMVEREVRSVVLVVRGMDGVAYTTGSRHDDAHKQIHLSADYVESLMHRWADEDEGGEERPARSAEVPKQQQDRQQQRSRMRHEQKVVAKTTVAPATRSALLSPSSRDDAPRIVTAGDHRPDKDRTGGRDRRRRRTGGLRNVEFEVRGVLVHELVHTVQFDGDGTAPGGLIEGIADWIRLKAGFAPSHWKRGVIGDSWDAGYERTAFFLDFASSFVGMRFLVPHLNQALAWHRWIVDDDDVKTALKHRRLRRCGNGEEDGRDGDDEEEPFTLFECLTGYSIAEVWRAYENSVER